MNNNHKPGTVLETSIGGVAIFNSAKNALVNDILSAKSKVIVLYTNPSGEYLKVLYDDNKIGFVLNYPNRWKEVK